MSVKGGITNVTQPQTLMIDCADIDADISFNARPLDPDHVDGLVRAIKKNKQFVPVVVRKNTDAESERPYSLVLGFHRFAACEELGRPVLAMVNEIADEKTAAVFNVAENIERKDLTRCQLGRALSRLKEEHEMTDAQIAASLAGTKGIGQKYVSRLIKIVRDVEPVYLEMWEAAERKGERSGWSVNFMDTMCRLTPEQQELEYRRVILGEDDDEKGEDGGDGSPKREKTPSQRAKKKDIELTLAHLDSLKSDSEGVVGAIKALKWVLGGTKGLRVDGIKAFPLPKSAAGGDDE